MVYCKLIVKTKDKALYQYGGLYNDLTGILEIDAKNETIKIIQEAQQSITFVRHIQSLYNKYKEDFKKGIFKDQIAYEI